MIQSTMLSTDRRRLDLQERQLGPMQLEKIIECLRLNDGNKDFMRISRLDVSKNNLGARGVYLLADWLTNCSGSIKPY